MIHHCAGGVLETASRTVDHLLPNDDQARGMGFKELAASIGAFLKNAEHTPPPSAQISRAETLVNLLLGLIPIHRPPEPPQRPSVPILPTEPARKLSLPIDRTAKYKETREKYCAEINALRQKLLDPSKRRIRKTQAQIAKLMSEMEEALQEITLAAQPESFVTEWRVQKQEWIVYEVNKATYLRECESYPRRLNEYNHRIEEWTSKYAASDASYGVFERIEDRFRRELKDIKKPRREPKILENSNLHVRVIKLDEWVPLRPGEEGLEFIMADIERRRRRHPHIKIDKARLDFAISLDPSRLFIGKQEWSGYYACVFDATGYALLDNLEEGNAAYIFLEDWMSLSKHSKLRLIRKYAAKVKRVIHGETGEWKMKLSQLLNINNRLS